MGLQAKLNGNHDFQSMEVSAVQFSRVSQIQMVLEVTPTRLWMRFEENGKVDSFLFADIGRLKDTFYYLMDIDRYIELLYSRPSKDPLPEEEQNFWAYNCLTCRGKDMSVVVDTYPRIAVYLLKEGLSLSDLEYLVENVEVRRY